MSRFCNICDRLCDPMFTYNQYPYNCASVQRALLAPEILDESFLKCRYFTALYSRDCTKEELLGPVCASGIWAQLPVPHCVGLHDLSDNSACCMLSVSTTITAVYLRQFKSIADTPFRHFSYPNPIPAKIWGVPFGVDHSVLLVSAESELIRLISREIISAEFQPI